MIATLVTATAEKLAEMLTENTGRHMLDSGSAYGRAWERNAGMVASDFLSRPAVTYDAEYQTISLDMFHYLNERLVYAPELTDAWIEFDAKRPSDSWNETLNEWLDTLGVDSNPDAEFYSDGRWEFNTYNFSECLLNGTFQGVKFVLGTTVYLALQIHGGCDVRGGYTKYAIFSGDVEAVILDTDRATLHCPECDFYADYYGGKLEDAYLGDSLADPNMLIEIDVPTEMPEFWSAGDGCPIHKVALV